MLKEIVIDETRQFLNFRGSKTEFALEIAHKMGDEDKSRTIKQRGAFESKHMMKISRILNGTTPFDLNLLEPWMASLPAEVEERIRLRILSEFFKVFVVKTPSKHEKKTEVESALQQITEDFSELLKKSAPAADGRYNRDDKDTAHDMILALTKLASSCLHEKSKLESINYEA